MERYNLPTATVQPASSCANQPPLPAMPHIGGPLPPRKPPHQRVGVALRTSAATDRLSADDNTSPKRLGRLSLREFCERISLLAELELPCAIYIANASAEQISRGVVRRIERDADRLNLFGDGFSLHLHQYNIDAIWLVRNGDEQGMAIEIHNRAGSLIARLFGIQDDIGAAVWQDVMGNPSFAVA